MTEKTINSETEKTIKGKLESDLSEKIGEIMTYATPSEIGYSHITDVNGLEQLVSKYPTSGWGLDDIVCDAQTFQMWYLYCMLDGAKYALPVQIKTTSLY